MPSIACIERYGEEVYSDRDVHDNRVKIPGSYGLDYATVELGIADPTQPIPHSIIQICA